jgi:hypothetical protein
MGAISLNFEGDRGTVLALWRRKMKALPGKLTQGLAEY